MHRVFGAWLLILILAVGGVSAGYAESGGASAGPEGRAPQEGVAMLARELASQVSEINHSSMISRAKKEKRIATAVRVAVVAATAYKQDPDEILGIGVTLAAEAARAAPPFTEVIARAVSFAPAIAGIDGASSRIRTAAFAAAKGPEARRQRTEPVAEYARTSAPPAAAAEVPPVQAQSSSPEAETAARPVTAETATPSSAAENPAGENTLSSNPTTGSKAYLGSNSAINLTAELGAKYDDNVFWTQTDKVGDTIVWVAPGAEYTVRAELARSWRHQLQGVLCALPEQLRAAGRSRHGKRGLRIRRRTADAHQLRLLQPAGSKQSGRVGPATAGASAE